MTSNNARRNPARSYDANRSSLAYDYAAYEPERQQQEVRNPQIRTIRRPKVDLRPAEKVSGFALAGFFSVAVLLALVLFSYVQLTALSSSVVALKKEVNTLQTENVALMTSYERAFDLETVEGAALAAGMSKPSPSQIYYLDTNAADRALIYTPQKETALDQIVSSLKQGVYSVVDYFA